MKRNLLFVSLSTLVGLYLVMVAVLEIVAVVCDLPITFGLIVSLILSIINFIIAPGLNDFIFKHLYKCNFDNPNVPEYLHEFIAQTCTAHDMSYPKIGIIDDGSPNAFTYGRTKNDARVVFTRGLLEILTPNEVKAVVAHELGHAIHYDMMFMTVAQIIPLVLYYVSRILINTESGSSRSSNSDSNSSGSVLALIGLISYFLYIASQYIILWLSRTREYYADEFSVEETKDPESLAKALVKIGFGLAIGDKNGGNKANARNSLGINDAKISKGMAISAYNNGTVSKDGIINAMKWERWSPWAKLYEFGSTHPLISNRLLAISDRCEEFGQPRYVVFEENKEESYFDDFLIELGICLLPMLVFIGWFIAIIVSVNNSYAFYSGKSFDIISGIAGILLGISLLAKLAKTHKNKDFNETTVKNLLGEVKVSNVTSIPCVLKGKIIGRGNPGCIFNEDFVLQDETGIIFLDYSQPLYIMNKISAFVNTNKVMDNEVTVTGWYRRSTAPYVEVKTIEYNGKTLKCHTYNTAKVVYFILLALSVMLLIAGVRL